MYKKRPFEISIRFFICVLGVALFGVLSVYAYSFGYSLNANYVTQAKSCWCWAASAENAIIYEYPQKPYTQWDAVRYIKGSFLDLYPDTGGTIFEAGAAATYISNNTEFYSSSETTKTYSFLKNEINSNHPVIVSSGYYSGGLRTGGHDTLIIGWAEYNGEENVSYFDPDLCSYEVCTFSSFCDGSYNGGMYEFTSYNIH